MFEPQVGASTFFYITLCYKYIPVLAKLFGVFHVASHYAFALDLVAQITSQFHIPTTIQVFRVLVSCPSDNTRQMDGTLLFPVKFVTCLNWHNFCFRYFTIMS